LRRRFDDVVFIAEVSPRLPDKEVLARAFREGRAVVTDDYDFGELVYRSGQAAEAIIIIAPGALGVDLHNDAEIVASRILDRLPTLRSKLTIIERSRTRERPLDR
jgi:predicted nuclease of predicted toxin-antitoxin system